MDQSIFMTRQKCRQMIYKRMMEMYNKSLLLNYVIIKVFLCILSKFLNFVCDFIIFRVLIATIFNPVSEFFFEMYQRQ